MNINMIEYSQAESCMRTLDYIMEKYKDEFDRARTLKAMPIKKESNKVRRKPITMEVVNRIMELHRQGKNIREIGDIVDCSKTIAHRVINNIHPLQKKKKK